MPLATESDEIAVGQFDEDVVAVGIRAVAERSGKASSAACERIGFVVRLRWRAEYSLMHQ